MIPILGKFIVFDGADNLGKTTQIEMVSNFLNRFYSVTNTKEPGGTNIGSRIRDILLNTDEILPKKAELLLFIADRSIHLENKIIPLLEQGEIVICDRYLLSTLAYQHNLRGNQLEDIMFFHDYIGNIYPDLTFVFHGKRITNDINDKYEEHIGDSHEKLNNYYIEAANKFKNHILIDANRPKEIIFKEIVTKIEELLLN
jgi:dTMP kinase